MKTKRFGICDLRFAICLILSILFILSFACSSGSSGDDDDSDDFYETDDDDSALTDNDDDAAEDDDDDSGDDDDEVSCAIVWLECEYLFHEWDVGPCGDEPNDEPYGPSQAWHICESGQIESFYQDLADCGFNQNCYDWKHEEYICEVEYYQDVSDCWSNESNAGDARDCVDDLFHYCT